MCMEKTLFGALLRPCNARSELVGARVRPSDTGWETTNSTNLVPETLSEEILAKMGAPQKGDAPIIEPNDLVEADGFIFGFPTRFGMMPAQFNAFLDATGGLWQAQKLAGKPAGIFYSTGSQGGGQETTVNGTISLLKNCSSHPRTLSSLGIGFTKPTIHRVELCSALTIGKSTISSTNGNTSPVQLADQNHPTSGNSRPTIRKYAEMVDSYYTTCSSWIDLCSNWLHVWSWDV
ncbi:probable NAD(P)H dehydrogenase (quinone) FQR1-like 1 [Capsicum annuum]|uniref:probable NAD(P)H dehydrogenase (quinone) FQR1-like 1 n=1 Tax=Capsicum annuum TaxID=4072 RepID=UPI001FB06497|nr:probable NAD(P)H dehydrogenase (quinone) FQR1-like 1 [Capsicum annuum]